MSQGGVAPGRNAAGPMDFVRWYGASSAVRGRVRIPGMIVNRPDERRDADLSRVIVAADNPAPVPRNCSNAGAKSRLDIPRRYSSGNTSATFGDWRAHA